MMIIRTTLRHRTFNRFWAHFRGYFWIPCPRCNQFFGGHERPKKRKYYYGGGKILCPQCDTIISTMTVKEAIDAYRPFARDPTRDDIFIDCEYHG